MAFYQLANSNLSMVIDSLGAGIINFNYSRNKTVFPIMPDSSNKSSQLGCASSFLMIPYSNRIENGKFTFDSIDYTLKRGEKHSIHGDVSQREWTVVETNDNVIKLKICSSDYHDFNWPWEINVEIEYRLEESSLFSVISITNCSTTNMPVGLGWHPFFSRHLTREGEPVVISFKCKGVYPDDHDTRIPSGPARYNRDLDFSRGKMLPNWQFIDACYAGYDGKGSIHWPLTGIKVFYECSDACTHAVLYNPIDMPYFAFEPVTNANNGVNMFSKGDMNSGVQQIAPDQTFRATWKMNVVSSE